ncbi:hypothetical protein [Priestia megaterium]|uniref:hypothetical protein n=1 Tax=Priestia megaterium TaxID=1404 RepID=UPI0025A3915E|nr:hypothetical protein [Priestia megaterium]MDM8151071.1 hypothetical protein [Priestia megaterium]
MSVLDARVINTKQGLETYLDLEKNINIKEVRIPNTKNPLYEAKFEVEYFLLKEGKYYDRQSNYFWITMNQDFNSLTLKETEIKSLFSVKDAEERESTKHLLGEWFIRTHAYKKSIIEFIQKIKEKNVTTEEDIEHVKSTITFLEKLSMIKEEDVKHAPIEKYSHYLAV